MNTARLARKDILFGIAAVIVLIVLIAAGASSRDGGENSAAESSPDAATSTVNETASSVATSAATSAANAAAKPAPALSYTQALNKYGANRMQFDPNCAVIPLQLSLKNGVSVMLDNRSPSARSVYLDRKEYRLAGFGYKVAALSYPKSALPHTVIVDCGTGRNNAKIIIQ